MVLLLVLDSYYIKVSKTTDEIDEIGVPVYATVPYAHKQMALSRGKVAKKAKELQIPNLLSARFPDDLSAKHCEDYVLTYSIY